MKYLKNWYQLGKDKYCFRHFYREGANYKIVETPDGHHEGQVVAEGLMKDLEE